MSTSNPSRDAVLDKIHKATATTAARDASGLSEGYAGIPREYNHKGDLSAEARVALLVERLREYGADVVESTPANLVDSIRGVLAASNRHMFVAPPDLPAAWLVPGFEWKSDHGLSHDEIEKADGVVTTAFCAIAESGTIVLHHHLPGAGRRVLTLLPDWHLCVLYASQVVQILPEYFARVDAPPPLVTWFSGPSATADIEMTRIKGVHGPRYLNVVLVRDEN